MYRPPMYSPIKFKKYTGRGAGVARSFAEHIAINLTQYYHENRCIIIEYLNY